MNLSFRVCVAVGILILAAAGCQQGKQPGATGKAESKGEAGRGAGSKAGKAHTKAQGAAAHGTSTAEARDGGAGSSRTSGRLTAADDGSSYDLRQGQVVTVVLESNRSSGLKWILVEPSGTVIVPAASPVFVARAAKSGGGGTETWRFRAAKPGKQTVRLEYRRQWQQVPERTFRFSVTVR
jgi:inhibitor of cysteine peptidase